MPRHTVACRPSWCTYSAVVGLRGDKQYTVFDRDGRIQIESLPFRPEYVELYSTAHVVRKEGKYGIYNPAGTALLEPKYNQVKSLKDGVFVVQKDKQYGLVQL